jgi:hypothetical protein
MNSPFSGINKILLVSTAVSVLVAVASSVLAGVFYFQAQKDLSDVLSSLESSQQKTSQPQTPPEIKIDNLTLTPGAFQFTLQSLTLQPQELKFTPVKTSFEGLGITATNVSIASTTAVSAGLTASASPRDINFCVTELSSYLKMIPDKLKLIQVIIGISDEITGDLLLDLHKELKKIVSFHVAMLLNRFAMEFKRTITSKAEEKGAESKVLDEKVSLAEALVKIAQSYYFYVRAIMFVETELEKNNEETKLAIEAFRTDQSFKTIVTLANSTKKDPKVEFSSIDPKAMSSFIDNLYQHSLKLVEAEEHINRFQNQEKE